MYVIGSGKGQVIGYYGPHLSEKRAVKLLTRLRFKQNLSVGSTVHEL